MGTAERAGRIRAEVLDAWRSRDLEAIREITWASMPDYNEKWNLDSLDGRHPTEELYDAKSSNLKRPT
jgi:hypothetical protein